MSLLNENKTTALDSISTLARTKTTFNRADVEAQLLADGIDTSAYEWAITKLIEPGFIVDLGGGAWKSEIYRGAK